MRWMAERFELPAGAGGLMTSGGAASNFTALKAAATRAAGRCPRGRHRRARPRPYTSQEAHATIAEAADMMGMGERAVRSIPTDERFRMRADELERASPTTSLPGSPVLRRRDRGLHRDGRDRPDSGRGRLCERHGLWLHVDAAYGGAAAFSPELRPLLAGIDRADTIAFDPHKWLYTPQSSACLLARDPQTLRAAFSIDAAYVREDAEMSGRGVNIGELGPQWSRAFIALKVWMSLAAHGTEAYARRIAHDVELARYLDDRVREHPDLESMCPVTLSIACFRYAPAGVDDATLDALNERLMIEIRRHGRTFPSNAVLTAATACAPAS